MNNLEIKLDNILHMLASSGMERAAFASEIFTANVR
jgi:hypothetical protein